MTTTTKHHSLITNAELRELRTASVFTYLGQDINIDRVEETPRQVTVIGYFTDGGPARIYMKRTNV